MAIDPKLVSIISASDLPTGEPTSAGEFFFFEGNEMKKAPMTNIYDKVTSGITGEATQSNAPTAWTTGDPYLFERWIVSTPLTLPNSWGFEVTQLELDENFVFFNVTDGVVSKELSEKRIAALTNTIDVSNETEAVTGKAVGDYVLNGQTTDSVVLINLPSFFNKIDGLISETPYGHTRTEKFLLKKGEVLKYGLNTYTLVGSASNIVFFNLDGTYKSTYLETTAGNKGTFVSGAYRTEEDLIVGISDYTEGAYGSAYAKIQPLNLNKGLDYINNQLINVDAEIDGLKYGVAVENEPEIIPIDTIGYYRTTGGDVSTPGSPYGHFRTEKVRINKGEKLNYGLNTFSSSSPAMLNLYSLEGVFIKNQIKASSGNYLSFQTGSYIADADYLIGVSDYREGAFGTAFLNIERNTPNLNKGLFYLLDKDSEAIDISTNVEANAMYLRGNREINKSVTKKFGIIVAGQSNTEGRVPIAQAPIYITGNDNTVPNVQMWNNGTKSFAPFKFGVNTGSGTGATTSTLYAYDAVASYLLGQDKAQTIYLIKRAVGGTAIDVSGLDGGGWWTPKTEEITSGRQLIEELKTRVEDALASDATLEIKAVLWHQGESDSTTLASDKYYQNLKNVIAYIRGIVGNPKLPFVFGTIATISLQYNATVDAAMRKVDAEDSFVYLVDMSAGTLLDAYHFDATSTNNLGTAMFDILKNL